MRMRTFGRGVQRFASRCLVVLAISWTFGSSGRVSGEEREFNPRVVAKPFPAIVNASFLPADEVTDQVHDNELVLGVVVGGEPRAYPINMLCGPIREIINDTLGGRAIAATW